MDEQPYADASIQRGRGKLNLTDFDNDFYTRSSHRLSKFGHFSEVHLR